METIKEESVEVAFLWLVALLGVRWVCWNVEMGTRTSDKRVNYSHEPAQIKQQVG